MVVLSAHGFECQGECTNKWNNRESLAPRCKVNDELVCILNTGKLKSVCSGIPVGPGLAESANDFASLSIMSVQDGLDFCTTCNSQEGCYTARKDDRPGPAVPGLFFGPHG